MIGAKNDKRRLSPAPQGHRFVRAWVRGSHKRGGPQCVPCRPLPYVTAPMVIPNHGGCR